MIGDVRDRNVKKLAARALKPFAFLTAFKLLTGYEIPGAHPLQAVTGVLSARPFPAVGGAAEQAQIKGAPQAAVQELLQFTPIGPAKRFARDIQKAKDVPEAILRLKQLPEDSITGKVRKQILKEFGR